MPVAMSSGSHRCMCVGSGHSNLGSERSQEWCSRRRFLFASSADRSTGLATLRLGCNEIVIGRFLGAEALEEMTRVRRIADEVKCPTPGL